ncbi:hypothetical protein GGS21DRAFT_527243 [Xylaria nigripes]|nr:hypothetical protein GGS21DRAFT_527243 [Xylaria nigripes]
MLTSLMVPRSRPLRVSVAFNNSFTLYEAPAQRSRHRLQTRAYRFGIWSSYLDPADRHESRRRCRNPKHDHVNKNISWHDHSWHDIPHSVDQNELAKSIYETFRPRWASLFKPDGQKIGSYSSFKTFSFDAESRHASPKGSTDEVSRRGHRQTCPDTKSQCKTDRRREPFKWKGASAAPECQESIQTDSNTTAEDYVIDPITNRKVPRREYGALAMDLDPQISTFKTYRSQFESSASPSSEPEGQPTYSNGKPSVAELGKYEDNKFDDWAADGVESPSHRTEKPAEPEISSPILDNSALKNEEYSLNHLPIEDSIEEDGGPDESQNAAADEAIEKPSGLSENYDVIHSFGASSQPTSEVDKLQKELEKYGPYMYDQELSNNVSDEPKDLDKYQYHASENSESSSDRIREYDDLHKYEPSTFDEIKDQDQSPEKYGDLEKYKAFKHQESDTTVPPERDAVAESLKEYECKEQYNSTSDVADNLHNAHGKLPRMNLPEGHVFSKHFSGRGDFGTAHSAGYISRTRQELQQHMDKLRETSDVIDREINSKLHQTIQSFKYAQELDPPLAFSESFVRDSPEELHKTRFPHGDQSVPTGYKAAILEGPFQEAQSLNQNTKDNAFVQKASDRPYGIHRLEPALDRHVSVTKDHLPIRAYELDLYSKKPQGLETSFSDECGGKDTLPLYTRTYGNEPGQLAARSKPAEIDVQENSECWSGSYYHRDPEVDGIPKKDSTQVAHDRARARPEEPTIYKILAYDPNTQNISIAETTSVVPDLVTPSSPTEVLPRLSNPTKFLPYFSSLEAEGFEIVTGRGDMLVFRQVRPGKAAAQGTANVNPIDLMGRPAAVPNAAAFVSPTGFVNYDVLHVEEPPAEPAFRSNIHVRREEPVFSGPKSSSGNKKGNKPRMRVVKRVILGGASVAGISYALGVVSEYFNTGGADGKGPTGFSPI